MFRRLDADSRRRHVQDEPGVSPYHRRLFGIVGRQTDVCVSAAISPEKAGTCVGNALGVGCGVFIQGPGCTITGKDLRVAYDELWHFGCTKCGWARDKKSGCEVRVDSVTKCWQ